MLYCPGCETFTHRRPLCPVYLLLSARPCLHFDRMLLYSPHYYRNCTVGPSITGDTSKCLGKVYTWVWIKTVSCCSHGRLLQERSTFTTRVPYEHSDTWNTLAHSGGIVQAMLRRERFRRGRGACFGCRCTAHKDCMPPSCACIY